nr:uncharacterized protein LOC127315917 [Lolium perenne]
MAAARQRHGSDRAAARQGTAGQRHGAQAGAGQRHDSGRGREAAGAGQRHGRARHDSGEGAGQGQGRAAAGAGAGQRHGSSRGQGSGRAGAAAGAGQRRGQGQRHGRARQRQGQGTCGMGVGICGISSNTLRVVSTKPQSAAWRRRRGRLRASGVRRGVVRRHRGTAGRGEATSAAPAPDTARDARASGGGKKAGEERRARTYLRRAATAWLRTAARRGSDGGAVWLG